jgi:hypothetical protein
MTDTAYVCGSALRRAVALTKGFNGIDYLEVEPNSDVTVPLVLRLTMLSDQGLPGLTSANFRITGGVRFPDPAIDAALQSAPGSSVVVITLPAPLHTDYSTYTLHLRAADAAGPPPGFDPQLAAVNFSFKINCPSPFDCAPLDAVKPSSVPAEPDLDYTARDWQSLRRLMLDRLGALLPDFREDTPVDFLVTQVESLAYAADHLSYQVDAVATDSTIWTARSRVSLSRHARLLDYPVHQGSNARCFAHFDYQGAGDELPKGTPLLPRIAGAPRVLTPDALIAVVSSDPVVFETMHPLTLAPGNNAIDFYTWSDSLCVLPPGATSATLRLRPDPGGGPALPGVPPAELAAGDFLLLAQTRDPGTGRPGDADRRRRHVVRLTSVVATTDPVEMVDVLQVAWATGDALPFELTISADVPQSDGSTTRLTCARASGNVALADHGVTLPPVGVTSGVGARRPELDPPEAPPTGRWRPRLTRSDLVWAAPLDLTRSPTSRSTRLSAAEAVINSPSAALPQVVLRDDFSVWRCVQSLLLSRRFDRDVVVETEHEGQTRLRFGDNVMGLAPAPLSTLEVSGRFGWPLDGKIGADTLWHVVTAVSGITAVGNALPAIGGVPPLSPTVIRVEAPQAFRVQQRAVTEADWAEVAQRHPEVSTAVARIRWTGAWRTAFVYLDRRGGLPVERDPQFRSDILAHLERFRLAGVDLALRGPVMVPLDIKLRVCVRPRYLRADVQRALLDRLGPGIGRGGRPGFFHPDNFTFSSPLYLSAVVAAAMQVPGVASVEALRLQRWAKAPVNELGLGVIRAGEIEVLQLDNDPNFPENGRLELELLGGL